MRAPPFAPAVFSIAFCLAYVPVFSVDWPLFLYHPLHGDFSRTPLPEEMGPAMHWYGLVATNERAREILGWTPARSTLPEMLGSAWAWRRRTMG